MLAKRLPVPAYDHLLKLSHTFNLLDARGAVGVTGGWEGRQAGRCLLLEARRQGGNSFMLCSTWLGGS